MCANESRKLKRKSVSHSLRLLIRNFNNHNNNNNRKRNNSLDFDLLPFVLSHSVHSLGVYLLCILNSLVSGDSIRTQFFDVCQLVIAVVFFSLFKAKPVCIRNEKKTLFLLKLIKWLVRRKRTLTWSWSHDFTDDEKLSNVFNFFAFCFFIFSSRTLTLVWHEKFVGAVLLQVKIHLFCCRFLF